MGTFPGSHHQNWEGWRLRKLPGISTWRRRCMSRPPNLPASSDPWSTVDLPSRLWVRCTSSPRPNRDPIQIATRASSGWQSSIGNFRTLASSQFQRSGAVSMGNIKNRAAQRLGLTTSQPALSVPDSDKLRSSRGRGLGGRCSRVRMTGRSGMRGGGKPPVRDQ